MKWEDDGSLSVERLSWNIPPPKKLNYKNSTYSKRKFKNKNSKIAPTVTENEINDLSISFNVDQGFPYWGDWGGTVPPHQPKIFSFPLPHLEKFPPPSRLSPPTKSQSPPLNNKFQVITQIAFLAVVIAPAPFLF